jgi:hypothetical protein
VVTVWPNWSSSRELRPHGRHTRCRQQDEQATVDFVDGAVAADSAGMNPMGWLAEIAVCNMTDSL